ncbi:MAG: carbonic anhydrase [Myxococcota bacterium]
MPLRRPRVTHAVLLATVVLGALALWSARGRFFLGAALLNAGLELQDHVEPFDFEHADAQETPEQVWQEFQRQNALASSVREKLPRTTEHPLVALMVCMDARLDTSELVGDTRRYYYVLRTAGSVMDTEEQEMLELAVLNGVKLVVLTRHTDCAAERVAADPSKRHQFPTLSTAVERRAERIAEFKARPLIAEKLRRNELLVKEVLIDTDSEHLMVQQP